MVNDVYMATLLAISKARADGQPWHTLARILREGVDDFPKWLEFLTITGAVTDPSPVMLRRFLSTFIEIQKIATATNTDVSELLPPSFTGAEVAVRLYERDSDAGITALKSLRTRQTTLEAVRTLLSLAPAPSGVSRTRTMKNRLDIIYRCKLSFANSARDLFPTAVAIEKRPVLRYFNRLGWEITDADRQVIAGADLYLADQMDRAGQALDNLTQSIVLAPYFPQFYIVVGPGMDDRIFVDAQQALNALNGSWIGIARVQATSRTAEIVKKCDPLPAEFWGRSSDYQKLVSAFGGRHSRSQMDTRLRIKP